MSGTLAFESPVLLGEIDPQAFQICQEESAKHPHSRFALSHSSLDGHPLTELFMPLVTLASKAQDGLPLMLIRVNGWSITAQPGEPFMDKSVRAWHYDYANEILVADTQPAEFIGGTVLKEALYDNTELSNIYSWLNERSDESLLNYGLTIQQPLPATAVLQGNETFHRTTINQLPYPVTRNLLLGLCEPIPQ